MNIYRSDYRHALVLFLATLLVLPAGLLFAQGTPPLAKPGKLAPGRNISGQLVKDSSVNMSELASGPTAQASSGGADAQPLRAGCFAPSHS